MFNKEDHVLETPRLILRHWNESDAEVLYSLASDPEVGPMAGWRPHESLTFTRTVLRTVFLSKTVFAIVPKDGAVDGKSSVGPIGSISLTAGPIIARELAEKEGELGYWIGSAYRRHGFAFEGVREVIRYAFEDLQLNRLVCSCYEDNDPSINLIDKLGFTYIKRKHNVYNPMLCEYRNHLMFQLARPDGRS